jgi:hypothetical protein
MFHKQVIKCEGEDTMQSKKQLSYVFIGIFILLWFLGPFTQLIQIIDLQLHVKLGLSEPRILAPGYAWFKADELSMAWADMTYLVAGVIFVVGVFMRQPWAIPFGFYTSATWSFILLMARIRWPLLAAHGFDVVAGGQEIVFYTYATIYVLFGWFSMYYLWRNRYIYDVA